MFIFGVNTRKQNSYGFLYNIYIKKEYRNVKIGDKVMKDCIEFSKKHKADKIYLNVGAKNNSAIRLYEKNGFMATEIVMELII